VNAQGRGHAGDVDPADQWVFDPNTNSYKLRLNAGTGDSRSRPGGGSPHVPREKQGATAASSGHASESPSDTMALEPRLPGQRRRRAAPPSSGGGHGRRAARPVPSKKQKAMRWGAGTLGLIVVAAGIGGYLLYDHFNGNIDKVDVGEENAAVTDGPVNILVLGTDSRQGQGNGGYGDAASVGHADTTFLFHVSEDRTNATALSIPRDMITDIPTCTTKKQDGSTNTIPAQQGVRFNTSLGQSGRDPGCTWRTVEKMTGLKVHHFMMADFNAVKTLSTAVGGVQVCTAKPINDPKSHLNLSAGRHTVKGEQALAFVRTRHAVGFGSDLDRIKLQQQFLSSMIRKMKSGGTLSSPTKLFNLANAMTKALTVDTGIGTVGKLTDLANDLKRVDLKNITFATVPVVDNPDDPATVVMNEAKAKPLFKMVQADKSLSKTKKGSKGKEPSKAQKVPASQVRVDVQNGGGPVGAAQQTVDWLQNQQGVTLSTNSGNAPSELSKSRLEFSSSQAGQAATLAEMMGLPKSAMKQSSAVGESMKLTLGADFTAAGEPVEAPEKVPDGVENVKANDKKVCAK
jgi:LCP family protein required for cell wall assembly